MIKILKRAKAAKISMAQLTSEQKNEILLNFAEKINKYSDKIIEANKKDIVIARQKNMSEALIDRLALNEKRIQGMIDAIHEIIAQDDPINKVIEQFPIKAGPIVSKVSVPLGVVLIIYESRPNVFVDSAALCIKSSNVSVLRGSSSAIYSNSCLNSIIKETLKELEIDENIVNFIEDTDRKLVDSLVKAREYIDVLIPRGGKGLKQYIYETATIPIIETGDGICHIFVDESAKSDMARDVLVNAKTQRPGTCNSCETVLFHKNLDINTIANITDALLNKNVEIRYQKDIIESLKSINYNNVDKLIEAQDSDFGFEFHDMIIAGRYIDNVDLAIDFINAHSTKHSESIISENKTNADKFLLLVDSAVVYHNASTRFTDGGEFGFGGEIGISTQMLHARGPMALKELTTYKYNVRGKGDVRK
ncbi:MAG: glutamate-5-semialdehyde dehydrogenase [Christensenellaceae bacterium]|nr:glutamate-5-semialdehyde dehydrogenase [Christensenellaceae bacterium]